MPTPTTPTPETLAASRDPRRSRRVVLVAGGLAVLAAAGFVAGGLASWNDTVELPQSGNTIGTIGFALVDATGGGGNVTTTFGPFVPGDSGDRYVGVQSGSASSLGGLTLAAVLADPPVTDSFGTEAAAAELTGNITVSVAVCATGWSAATAATCAAGWVPTAISGATLQSLVDTPAALDEALPASAAAVGVRLSFAVDPAIPDTAMGASLPITWQFTASSRAGVSSK